PGPLALRPDRPGWHGHVCLRRRPRGRCAGPGSGGERAPRRARGARRGPNGQGRGAPGRSNPFRKARAGRGHPGQPAGPHRGVRRLSARDFRRYRELDIAFAPGLTVVRGPNESGKTTVQRALELVLTRRATSTAAELEGLRPWDAPPTSRSTVSIEFEQDDEDG